MRTRRTVLLSRQTRKTFCDWTLVMMGCLLPFFIHLQLVLLTQCPASNDKNIYLYLWNIDISNIEVLVIGLSLPKTSRLSTLNLKIIIKNKDLEQHLRLTCLSANKTSQSRLFPHHFDGILSLDETIFAFSMYVTVITWHVQIYRYKSECNKYTEQIWIIWTYFF